MRSLLLLAVVCCVVLSAFASPIARSEEDSEVARQSAAAAVAPAAAPAEDDDDDDEDDDEDDDPIAALAGDEDDDDDDDDDDDEEEDDEEEGDLFGILDLFGGDDDEDDDDTPSVPAPAAAPAVVPQAVVEPVAEEAAAASAENAETPEAESVDGDEEGGQKEPASAEVESVASEGVAETAAEDEDDEDDEDDLSDALEDEDDEEEEDDDDDDEDGDLSDALGRNISTKHSRSLKETKEPTKKQAPVPAIYIVKYNKFVDTILEKMNDVLRQSYDPVSVKLQPIDASKKTSKPKKSNKTKSKGKKKASQKKKNSARGDVKKVATSTETPTTVAEENTKVNEIAEVPTEQIQNAEARAINDKENGKAKPTATKPKQPIKATKPTKAKPKPPTKTTTKKPATINKNKTKISEKSKPRAKGTLYGLSSLRRTGDVAVNIMADHTTVKTNFMVGPLILRVEKVVGRGAKKEVKSATATTAEMTGKLSLRINNEGVATLHSIKVLQPKQVRVDSNHERTRELVWRRSARIAHVVSEKLLSVSKPMFHHQQQQVIKQ